MVVHIFHSGGVILPPVKHLTDRDVALLTGLATCGVMTHEQVRRIYNNVANYHYKRLSQLEDRGYVKCGRYIEITPPGMKEIGRDAPPVRKRQGWGLEKLILLSDVYIGLPEWRYLSSREIKKEMNLNDSSAIDAYIEKDGLGYAIYLLSKEPRKTTIQSIRGELKKLWTHHISNAVVFAPSPEGMNMISGDGVKLDSLLVLPYPYGIQLLAHKSQLESEIKSKLQGFTPSSRPFADYEKGNTFVSVLAFNDVIKRENLLTYLQYANLKEGKEIIITCFKDQSPKFRQLFPNIEQLIMQGP